MKEAIPVTAKHIREGNHDWCGCPIALAVGAFYRTVNVCVEGIWLVDGSEYRNDAGVKSWITRFDLYPQAETKPFILILDHKAKTAEMLTQ